MYRIIGQPINFRYVAVSKIIKEELSDKAKQIIKISEFGLKYGYKAAISAFNFKKSMYYEYVKLYKACKANNLELEVKSKRPHTIRKANWDKKPYIRYAHANIGNKMTPFQRHRQLVNDGKIIN